MAESPSHSGFKIYSWILFGLISVYLLLRAAFLEPLHDESATFLHLIEPEHVFGHGVIQDANNHLLNSYIGVCIYHFFGQNFFLLRLPNVICFAVYFWGVYQLVKPIRVSYFKIILLTAMATVAYMDEYFAYTRGYGMGIAFFIWTLIFSMKWVEKQDFKHAFLLLLLALLAVFSNLIFIVSTCLAASLVGFVHLRNLRQWSLRKNVSIASLYVLFLAGLYPFVFFSYMLKMGGALYYGSLEGFWEVTGKTLSRYVLFYDADWPKWFWLSFILIFAALLLYVFFRKGFWPQLKNINSILGWYLFGNIAAIFILAKLFLVNYPEDRAGMYFIPLIILIFGFSILKNRFTRPFIFLLLFFPVSFLAKMNLETSIFTADDRINTSLYQAVRKELNREVTMAIYPTMNLNWPIHDRESAEVKFQPCIDEKFSPLYDVFINKKKNLKNSDLSNHQLIYEDVPGGIVAYKRKAPTEKILLEEFQTSISASSSQKIDLIHFDLTDSIRKLNLMLQITGEMQLDKKYKDVRFFVSTFDKDGNLVKEQYFDQRWIHGANNLHFMVNINCVLKQISARETELRLYLWNPQYSRISFKNGKSRFYKLIE